MDMPRIINQLKYKIMSRINLGSVNLVKKTGKYQVYFQHVIENKATYIGSFDNEELANTELNKFVFDFYSKYSFLLPKGIFISRVNDKYIYAIQINKKNKHIFISKNLKEVIDARIDFINSLLF